MRAYHFEEFIARPPEAVWRVLTDLSRQSQWRPLVVSMETTDGGPLAVGRGVRIVHEYFGRRRERVSTTTALEPNRRWQLHSASTPEIEGWFDFVLKPEGSGTRVIATCELKPHGVLPRLFLPLIARGERRLRTEMLGNLKRLVERD